MYNCFLSQIMILVLLTAANTRIFFIKNARIDCFATFAPFAFIVSVVNLFCFGITLLNIVILIISFISFVTNFRSILRLHANLFVDHYNTGFLIFTILNLVLVVITAVAAFAFRPVKIIPEDFNVSKKEYVLTGNTTTSIRIKSEYLNAEIPSGRLYVYSKSDTEENQEEKPSVLFAGGVSNPSLNYEPYFILLAQKGYRVISGDFYTSDTKVFRDEFSSSFLNANADSRPLRTFVSQFLYLFQNQKFHEIQKKDIKNSALRYEALTRLGKSFSGQNPAIFYVVDGVDFDTIYSVIDSNSDAAKGFFSLNRIDEYISAGFGFVEQVNPLFALKLNLKRDKSLFIPRYAANKTIENIQSIMAVLKPEENSQKPEEQ